MCRHFAVRSKEDISDIRTLKIFVNKLEIHGKSVDDNTRCVHYHSPLDIIAIKFRCCNRYYPCYQCHEEAAGHMPDVWRKDEWNTPAIVCGVCRTEMTIREYVDSANVCPHCGAGFNPKCSGHYHLYFEV